MDHFSILIQMKYLDDIHRDCTCESFSPTPLPCQHLFSIRLLIIAILTSVRWNSNDILICIFLMTKILNILKHTSFFLFLRRFYSVPQIIGGCCLRQGLSSYPRLSNNLVYIQAVHKLTELFLPLPSECWD